MDRYEFYDYTGTHHIVDRKLLLGPYDEEILRLAAENERLTKGLADLRTAIDEGCRNGHVPTYRHPSVENCPTCYHRARAESAERENATLRAQLDHIGENIEAEIRCNDALGSVAYARLEELCAEWKARAERAEQELSAERELYLIECENNEALRRELAEAEEAILHVALATTLRAVWLKHPAVARALGREAP